VLGPQQLGHRQGEVFLGREFGHQPNYSEHVAASIDAEVRLLIDDAHTRARDILTLHRDTLDTLAAALVEKETLEASELMEIIGSLPTWPAAPAGASRGAPGHAPNAPNASNGPNAAVSNAFNRDAVTPSPPVEAPASTHPAPRQIPGEA
jgi:cell division protease FtsH